MEKAQRLISENRVVLVRAPFLQDVFEQSEAIVAGDTGAWVVRADPSAVTCSCPAWRQDRPCSHQLAAMAAWAQEPTRVV